jgi:hypothetical protein
VSDEGGQGRRRALGVERREPERRLSDALPACSLLQRAEVHLRALAEPLTGGVNLARLVREEYIRCTVKATVVTCLLAVLLMASTACGGNGNGDGDGDQAVFREYGVSFNYPAKWQKTQDVPAPPSKVWVINLVLGPPSDLVTVVGEAQSEFSFPASNLAAFRAYIVGRLKVHGFRVQSGSEKLTIDGRPGLRFRAKHSWKGKLTEETFVITFKGKTLYRFECIHRKRAAEIERGCAQIVRTFKVGQP